MKNKLIFENLMSLLLWAILNIVLLIILIVLVPMVFDSEHVMNAMMITTRNNFSILWENYAWYIVVSSTVEIIFIFFSTKTLFSSFQENKQFIYLLDWGQKENFAIKKRYSADRYKLHVSGFVATRMFWFKKEENKSFFEVTLPGCAMGPDCSICVSRKNEFNPKAPFKMILGDRNNWIAEIDGLPADCTNETLSEFLGLKVSVLK